MALLGRTGSDSALSRLGSENGMGVYDGFFMDPGMETSWLEEELPVTRSRRQSMARTGSAEKSIFGFGRVDSTAMFAFGRTPSNAIFGRSPSNAAFGRSPSNNMLQRSPSNAGSLARSPSNGRRGSMKPPTPSAWIRNFPPLGLSDRRMSLQNRRESVSGSGRRDSVLSIARTGSDAGHGWIDGLEKTASVARTGSIALSSANTQTKDARRRSSVRFEANFHALCAAPTPKNLQAQETSSPKDANAETHKVCQDGFAIPTPRNAPARSQSSVRIENWGKLPSSSAAYSSSSVPAAVVAAAQDLSQASTSSSQTRRPSTADGASERRQSVVTFENFGQLLGRAPSARQDLARMPSEWARLPSRRGSLVPAWMTSPETPTGGHEPPSVVSSEVDASNIVPQRSRSASIAMMRAPSMGLGFGDIPPPPMDDGDAQYDAGMVYQNAMAEDAGRMAYDGQYDPMQQQPFNPYDPSTYPPNLANMQNGGQQSAATMGNIVPQYPGGGGVVSAMPPGMQQAFVASYGSYGQMEPQASQEEGLPRGGVKAEGRKRKKEGAEPKGGAARKNKKPVFWTPEDHEKFLKGLEKFGMTDHLGAGGAELLSLYMGNRSVLQIKSHAQKYFSDLAAGRAT